MINNNEFTGDYANQLVSGMTIEQREVAFKYLEGFFNPETIAVMQSDVKMIMHDRAEMDRRLAELDAQPIA